MSKKPPTEIEMTFRGNPDQIRVLNRHTGEVWRWVPDDHRESGRGVAGQWIVVGRYWEADVDMGENVVRTKNLHVPTGAK